MMTMEVSMRKNEEVTLLAGEIMLDITNNRLPLNNILLKTAQLSLLLDIPDNVKLFKGWSIFAEQNSFVIGSFQSNIESAKDPDVSLTSSNPNQYVGGFYGTQIPHNLAERNLIRKNAEEVVGYLARYRAEAYEFALGVYNKWKFGNIAETIFEKKRKNTEPFLEKVFPDFNQRINSIEQNLKSTNPEDWKNSVASCRALLMDISNTLNPKTSEDKQNWVDRIKEVISPKIDSRTKKKIFVSLLEEVKNRIEYTADYTQGAAHTDRPEFSRAEDVVLYTYLIVAEVVEAYQAKDEGMVQQCKDLEIEKSEVKFDVKKEEAEKAKL